MANLVGNLQALGTRRLAILGGVGAALLLMVLLGLNAVTSPNFSPLYRNLSLGAANSVEAALSSAGFKVQVSDDGTSVAVPQEDIVRARMVLAESGVPIDGDPGWELFDQSNGLAMNSFLQKVNRLRAMEGELARSIQTLDGMQSARVHLVLPEREPFSRETPQPRASVVVRPIPGRAISRKQALSIRNLVASAVAELDLSRVTVLSASGETILAETTDGDGPATAQTAKFSMEDRLSREIQDILTARVGAGNARVRVNVDVTTSREVIVEQAFDPNQQVVRSTENNTESQAGSEGGGNVGVENNIPAALADGGAGPTSQKSRSGEVVNYEIGNTRREIIREAGEVEKITVAVLVNGIYNVQDSDVEYTERTREELDRLAELIKSAVGYDEKRGDSVSVDSMRFMDYSMDVGEPVDLSIGQQISRNIVPILRGLLALVVVGLVMVLGVRPALRQLAEPPALPDVADGGELLEPGESVAASTALENNATDPAQAPAIESDPASASATDFDIFDPASDTGDGEYIETMGIRGNLLKARVEAIQKLADDRPDDVLRVLRSWMTAEVKA
ncbi:MAG: flagellar basal-body MS-ring/collar protein FliF [Brevirhabdus sp.]